MLRVINASDTLRQAAFEFRHDATEVILAKRMGVDVDDRQARLVSAVFSVDHRDRVRGPHRRHRHRPARPDGHGGSAQRGVRAGGAHGVRSSCARARVGLRAGVWLSRDRGSAGTQEAADARDPDRGGGRPLPSAGLRQHHRRADRAAADVSPRTFSRYFPTKESVVAAIADDMDAYVAEALAASAHRRHRVRGACWAHTSRSSVPTGSTTRRAFGEWR